MPEIPDVVLEMDATNATIRSDVVEGLLSTEKYLPSKYFYDARGAELFTEITALEEYYLTRTENAILERYLEEIIDTLSFAQVLIEYGSGESEKTRLLLDNLPGIRTYVPIDISGEQLRLSALRLSEQYPGLNVVPYCADFTRDTSPYVSEVVQARSVVFFPGSTIGNFEFDQAREFLRRISQMVGRGGGLLIGVDLKKDRQIVERAYNDDSGVTAAFNKNILLHINNRLQSNFDPSKFVHKAIYNQDDYRVEMYLVSSVDHSVRIDDHLIHFPVGESIRTEFSHKYPMEIFARLAQQAGFVTDRVWTDTRRLFSVQYLRVN